MNRREFESTIHTELDPGGSYADYLALDQVLSAGYTELRVNF